MAELELLEFLALRMEVNPFNDAFDLVEAYVVESLKARPGYARDSVVGHQEVLLPSHKYCVSFSKVLESEVAVPRVSLHGFPSGESVPVLDVDFVRRTPVCVLSKEGVLGTDDFALEVGR